MSNPSEVDANDPEFQDLDHEVPETHSEKDATQDPNSPEMLKLRREAGDPTVPPYDPEELPEA